MFYRQSRNRRSFLCSDNTISRTNYLRILILASIDMLLTLPIGIVNIVLKIIPALKFSAFPVYPGWIALHSDWAPVSFSYAQVKAGGTAAIAQFYFTHWISPILAFAIFGLFGLTAEACASYWSVVRAIVGWFGWKPRTGAKDMKTSLRDIEFQTRIEEVSTCDAVTRCARFLGVFP